jgi:LPXTG-motif cell wall-anchored protein
MFAPGSSRSLPPLLPYRFTFLAVLLVAQLSSFTGRASASEGWGIVVDPKGAVSFTDLPSETVWKILPGSREKIAIDKHTRALVLGADGKLYGSEPAPEAAVWAIDREGSLSYVVPPSTNLPMDLEAFTLDAQGAIYSTSAGSGTVVLQKRGPGGRIETVAGGGRGHADGKGSAARFQGIDGMAWGPDGRLYVADGPYVRTVTVDGTVATLGGGAMTKTEGDTEGDEDLLGLAVAADGTVYAAAYGERRVIVIPPGGRARTLVRTGRFWSPAGVAAAGGDLYLLEHLGGPLAFAADLEVGPYARVRKLSPAGGNPTVLTTLWGGNTVAGAGGLTLLLLVGFFLLRRKRRDRYGAGRRIRL